MGKKCSEVERAYLAGFLGADGVIMALIEKHSEKHFKFRVRVRVVVKITQRKQTTSSMVSKHISGWSDT